MAGVGPGPPRWRRHVGRELERRERETRSLRGLVLSHEKLLQRRDLEKVLAENLLLDAGTQESRAPLELVSLRLQHAVELAELRGAKEELAQSIIHLSDALKHSEAECQEHRARAGRCAQQLAGLSGRCAELEGQLWAQAQETEGLQVALGAAQEQLRTVQLARDQLEARLVQEKQLEAERMNEANGRQERYQNQVLRLRQKLVRLRQQVASGSPLLGAELVTRESSCNTSCEELNSLSVAPRGSSSPVRGEARLGEGADPTPGPMAEPDAEAP